MTNPPLDWQAPIPLGALSLPKWPNDVFPGEIQHFVCELAKSTETPLELSSLSTLSAISTAAQGKYIVQVKLDYFEPVNIWTAVGLLPGSRKSSVHKTTTEPLSKWELEQKRCLEPLITKAISENKSLEARIKELRHKAASASASDYEKLKNEVAILESTLKPIPTLPQLWTADITPENLGTLMAENNECMAILSDEAGIFDILSGRYSAGVPNLDLFLQAHSGTAARVNRASRIPIFLKHPALTMGLTPQPDLLKGLTKTSAFRGRGLLARFLYAIPPSNLGTRSLDAEPLSHEIKATYDSVITDILNHPINDEAPHVLKLSKEAFSEWHASALVIEIKMGEGGSFAYMRDWAGKLPGAIIRIAGLLHIARYAKNTPWMKEIGLEDIKAAIKIGNKLADHALAVFDLMGADPALDGAKVILNWIKVNGFDHFTFRDCHYAHKNRFKRAKEFAPCIELLIENYFIREREQERKSHRPSRVFDVNPGLNTTES